MPAATSRRLISAAIAGSASAGRVTRSPSGVDSTGCGSRTATAAASSSTATYSVRRPPLRIWSIGPCHTTRPSSTIATASQIFSTSSRRCEESTTVRPSPTSRRTRPELENPGRVEAVCRLVEVRNSGSLSSARAMPSRCRMPSEYFFSRSSAPCGEADALERALDPCESVRVRAAAIISRFSRPVRNGWKRAPRRSHRRGRAPRRARRSPVGRATASTLTSGE